MLAAIALASVVTVELEEIDAKACDRAVQAVLATRRGAVENRWRAVGSLEANGVWDAAARGNQECRERVLRTVRATFEAERDDRFRCAWMDSVPWQQLPELTDFLRDGLNSRSPNVLRRALQEVAVHPRPELSDEVKALWRGDHADEVTGDLFRASGALGDRSHARDILAAFLGDSQVLRLAAVQALRNLPDAEAVGPMTALIETDSEAVWDVVNVLTEWESVPGADDALVQLAATPRFPVAGRVVSVFADRGPRGVEPLRRIQALSEGQPLADLIDHLLESIEAGTVSVTTSCGISGTSGPDDPDLLTRIGLSMPRMIVQPDDERSSLPCLTAPGIHRSAPVVERLTAGTVDHPIDVFWWEDEKWLAVHSAPGICWVPERMLAPDRPGPSDGEPAATELDVRPSALGHPILEWILRRDPESIRGLEDGLLIVRVAPLPTEPKVLLGLFRAFRSGGDVARTLWLMADGAWQDAPDDEALDELHEELDLQLFLDDD